MLLLGYVCLLESYLREWNAATSKEHKKPPAELPYISIVIVARNEGLRLTACIESIIGGSYPATHYEIIVVDDYSTDGSFDRLAVLEYPCVRMLYLEDVVLDSGIATFKKAGQRYGISEAQYDWIVTTDADCLCPSEWLKTLSLNMSDVDLMTGLIRLNHSRGWLSWFQVFDVIGTMVGTLYGINKGLWYSANTGNMAFRKSLYQSYLEEASDDVASGDDMFLIQWAASKMKNILFVADRSAMVNTDVEGSWKSLWHQRIRWAGKSRKYQDKGLLLLGIMMVVFDMTIIALGILALVIGAWALWVLIFVLAVRIMVDYRFLSQVSLYFGYKYSFWRGCVLSIMHIAYVVVVAIWSQMFSHYIWKGRTTRSIETVVWGSAA